MAYTIDKIIKNKQGFEITIANQTYLVDSSLYPIFLPYIHKEIEIDDFKIIQIFSDTFFVLKPLYSLMNQHKLSVQDIKSYLLKKEIEPDTIEIILHFLLKETFLDDKLFVNNYFQIYQKDKGIVAFKNFLNQHGISSSLKEEFLKRYQENENYIQNYIQRQVNQNHHSLQILKYKIKQNLLQKGFSQSIIEKYLQNLEIDETPQLLKDYQKIQKNEKNPYKIISKLVHKGYNVDDIKKIMKDGEDYE